MPCAEFSDALMDGPGPVSAPPIMVHGSVGFQSIIIQNGVCLYNLLALPGIEATGRVARGTIGSCGPYIKY